MSTNLKQENKIGLQFFSMKSIFDRTIFIYRFFAVLTYYKRNIILSSKAYIVIMFGFFL